MTVFLSVWWLPVGLTAVTWIAAIFVTLLIRLGFIVYWWDSLMRLLRPT